MRRQKHKKVCDVVSAGLGCERCAFVGTRILEGLIKMWQRESGTKETKMRTACG